MFIPSEALYYDLLINKIWNFSWDLIEYAFRDKRVIIVWPTSFYAYLQTVLQWLKALKIEWEINEIKKYIHNLSRHLKTYELYLDKLWITLNTSLNHYEKAKKEFEKIDKDIFKITND
jgi:DNA recombination protein RmuC